MSVAYTIGHSTRTTGELVALLREHGVELLVDVRRYPRSRRHPHFDREALRETLPTSEIDYRHEEALGGYREPDPDSPNGAWESDGFRGYADHLLSEEGGSALDRLVGEVRTRRVAVMCAEAVPWRCHRQVLSDALVARGVDVVHILGPGQTDRHELRGMAVVREDASVVYPDEQGDFFEG